MHEHEVAHYLAPCHTISLLPAPTCTPTPPTPPAEGDTHEHEVAPAPNPRVLAELQRADAIIYGMGSLYTSVVPSLILRGVGECIAATPVPKVRGWVGGWLWSGLQRKADTHGSI